jgi:subtilase family serine protease
MQRSSSALLSLCSLSTLILCVLILSTLSFAAPPDRITGPIVSSQLVKLSAGVPMRAPGTDQGRVDPSLKLGYMTLLTVPSASQQEAINQLLSQQQDPNSPLYHQWLTPEQYADRFGLSPNDIQKLTAWLQSQGFTVVSVARGRNFIVFSGTAAQAEAVFQTEIHNFDVGGKKHFSNITAPSIPAALSGIVTGIRGLSNVRARSNAVHSKPNYTEPVTGGVEYWIAPGDITTMYDLQKLYTAGINGSGQKLAIVGETDVYLADLNDFRAGFDLTPQISGCTFFTGTNVISACNATNFQYVVVEGQADPGSPDSIQTGDLIEADIDLEWSAAVAQQAQIVYVNAPDPSGNGVYDSMYYTIDQDLAPVMSMSYSIGSAAYPGCELGEAQVGTLTADEAEFAQANLKGITFLNATGDNGAAECDPNATDEDGTLATGGLALSYPSSSPSITGVGGTMIPWTEYTNTYWSATNGSTGGSATEYIPEQGWNDAQEVGAYCVANPSSSNCTSNDISSWATAQAFFGIVAGGGGASNCVTIDDNGVCNGGQPQPLWQQNLVIQGQTTAAHSTPDVLPVRFSPDVSLLASELWPGFIVCTPVDEIENSSDTSSICAHGISGPTGFFSYGFTFGGTSIATPMFAGIVSLLNESLGNTGLKGLGNINATLYSLAATPANGVFNQLASNSSPGSNGVFCTSGTPDGWPIALQCPAAVAPATEGFFGYAASDFDPTTNYNLVTGLGSVDAYNLVHSWSSATTPAYTLSAGAANPTSVSPGSSSTATVTVTSVNSYSGTVTLSCTISPVITGTTAPTCGFSPNPVSVTSSGGSSTLTFSTVAPSSDVQKSTAGTRNMASASSNPDPTAKPSSVKLQFFALLLPISGLTLVGFVFGSSATQRRRMRFFGLICLLSTALVLLPSCGGGSSSSTATGCLAVPAVPTGLAASGTTSSGTTLTWTASTAPANCSVTGYTVYQNGNFLTTTTSATYNVTALTAGTQYSFTVAANDSYGVSAQSSPPVIVTTTGTTGTPSGSYTISITGKDVNGLTQSGAAATVTVTVN